jgi:cellulose synthase/poly-beta-1,6-N-acetylglucosamine synthase-like glycosyltransferase
MSNADMVFLIIAVASISLYSWLILSLYRGWTRLEKFELKDKCETFISVIIPMRNEAGSLQKLMDLLKLQQYPDDLHEFILVNDHSTDEGPDVLKNIHSAKIFHLPDGVNGKKAAITYGIEHAKANLITTLDADCLPGPHWLACIATTYEEGNYKMVAGPVAIHEPKGFLASFQALELLSLVASGGGAIGIGKPIMCNGANLTYEKKVFEEVEGFKGNEHIPGGDDIFLMEKVNRHYPEGSIGFIKDAEGMVYTPASSGVNAFIKQRFRWVAKSPSYKDPFLIYSALVVLGLNLVLLTSFIRAFISLPGLWIFMGLFLFKCLVDYPILRSATKLSRQQHQMTNYIPFQFIYFFFVSFSGILGNVFSFSWKERTQ